MASIISYRKAFDPTTTYRLAVPDGAECIELAEIGGITYVSVPDGVQLPPQPEQIAATVATITLDQPTNAVIQAASPHCALIDQRMRDQIRASYSVDDELKFARIGVGAAMGMYSPTSDEVQAMTVFGQFVESVRQWGRDERAKLGL